VRKKKKRRKGRKRGERAHPSVYPALTMLPLITCQRIVANLVAEGFLDRGEGKGK